MLSITTQILLAEHLRLISECELEVELIREVLSEQKLFDPAIAFLSLTHTKTFKNPCSSENLQDFFTSNSVSFKPKEISRLIRCYDSDGDTYLSFQDFLNFILPSNSASLRNISHYQDSSFSDSVFLNYELTWALLRVFEKELENNRKIKKSLKDLRSRYDFNLSDSFTSIDLQGLGYLDADAIYNFFMKNKLKITDNEILFLFRKFDKDQDGKISIQEFENEMNMVGINRTLIRSNITNSSNKLKSPNKTMNLSMKSPYSANNSQSNKKLQRKTPKKDLEKTPDIYKSNEKDMKYLNNSIKSIKDSLKKSRIEPNIEDYTMRVNESPERVSVSSRRLYRNYQFNQMDSDEKLNRDSPIREIEQKIQKQETIQNQVNFNNSVLNRSNQLITGNFGSNKKNNENRDQYYSTIASNIKKSPERNITDNNGSMRSPYNGTLASGSKKSPEIFHGTFGSNEKKANDFMGSGIKKSVRSYESPKKRNVLLTEYDEKELVRTLKLQIDLDREIEATKNDLALQTDFNLLEAFKLFDFKGNGSLTLYDLNKAFANLDIHLSEDETLVFIKRFDKTMENVLKYSDFCDIFTPRSEEFHHILSSRSPSINIEYGFCDYTKRLIQKIVLQILETEKTCNILKKKLSDRESFTMQDAFTALDRDQNGYISIDEFRAILHDYDIIPTTSDLINLMKRYDKNRDGKVTFSEFVSELTPKKNY